MPIYRSHQEWDVGLQEDDMDTRSFEAALRAAAKVTLGTALLGCGATVEVVADDGGGGGSAGGEGGSDEVSSEGGAGEVASQGGAPGLGGQAPLATCSEPEGGWGVYERETFGCCVATVDAAAPADPTTDPDWGFGAPSDPLLGGCCAQILTENYQAIWSQEPLPHPTSAHVLTACCVLAHGDASCTPWGPPCPPAMDDVQPVPWIASHHEEVLA